MDAARQLKTWSPEQVAQLLRARPDLAQPPPADLAELARRAQTHASVRAAVHDLPTASRLVLEALVLLDGGTVEALVQLSDPAPTHAQVTAALQDLRDRLLLGPATTRVARDVIAALPSAGRLGHGLDDLLLGQSAHALHRLAEGLGLPPSRTKALALERLLGVLGDPAQAHELLSALPAGLQARLRELDADGPVVAVRGLDPTRGSYPDDPDLEDLVAIGLVVLRGGPYVEVPREIALGLRHPRPLRLALAPPDETSASPAPTAAVAAGSASAAHAAVAALDGIAEAMDRTPLPLLATAGVGVRDLRKVADQIGRPAADVATLLELAADLGLVRMASKDLRLTKTWDTWRRTPDAERWAQLARAWSVLPLPPASRTGRLQPALKSFGDHEYRRLRGRLLEVLRLAPRDVAAPPPLWAARYAARWYTEPQLPYGPVRRPVAGELLADLLAEAELCGLVVDGAPTPLCDLAPEVLATLDDVGEERVRAQADGTLVCTGTPSRRMRADLDRLAAVESRGAATVWRLTEASLTRAYGGALSAAEALAALERWAGDLPQAMRYLVQDAERRSGRLRTGAASSYLVAEDEAALADALAALRGLKLTRVAPTVAVSAAHPDVLAAALTKAGLAASGAAAAGGRPTGKRAAAVSVQPLPVAKPLGDVDALAQRLARR